jgi:hypothetical protein
MIHDCWLNERDLATYYNNHLKSCDKAKMSSCMFTFLFFSFLFNWVDLITPIESLFICRQDIPPENVLVSWGYTGDLISYVLVCIKFIKAVWKAKKGWARSTAIIIAITLYINLSWSLFGLMFTLKFCRITFVLLIFVLLSWVKLLVRPWKKQSFTLMNYVGGMGSWL